VVANGIAAAYSLVQGVRCVVGMVKGSVLFSKPLAWVIFSGDQVLISFLFSSLGNNFFLFFCCSPVPGLSFILTINYFLMGCF